MKGKIESASEWQSGLSPVSSVKTATLDNGDEIEFHRMVGETTENGMDAEELFSRVRTGAVVEYTAPLWYKVTKLS